MAEDGGWDVTLQDPLTLDDAALAALLEERSIDVKEGKTIYIYIFLSPHTILAYTINKRENEPIKKTISKR